MRSERNRSKSAAGTREGTVDPLNLQSYLSERSPLPLIAVEGLTHIVRYVNPAFCLLTGKTKEDLLAKPFAVAVPEGAANRCLTVLANVYRTGIAESLADQEHLLTSAEPSYWSYAAWAILDINEQPAGVMIHVTDSTQTVLLQQTSEALNQALLISGLKQHELTEAAKTLNARLRRAVRETHHRVKNNLQVVAALVEMQIGEGSGGEDARLRRFQQHIRTLATIHDLLTQQAKEENAVNQVSVSAILGELIYMLQETSGGRSITASIADAMLPVQRVAALGLVVSECVSNALKHAQGKIEITLRVEGAQAQLEVCDDGPGFPPDFDPDKAAHIGLELIESMTRFDLRGSVRYDNHPRAGGRVVVTFPIDIVAQ